jgi:hypothetical protein
MNLHFGFFFSFSFVLKVHFSYMGAILHQGSLNTKDGISFLMDMRFCVISPMAR